MATVRPDSTLRSEVLDRLAELGRRPKSGELLRRWDSMVIPRLQRLEQRREPPFGRWLFAVGRQP